MSGLTVNDPVSLVTAITSNRVIPGDVINLLPGDYIANEAGAISGSDTPGKGVFRVKVQGTAANPITIQAQIPGTVTITGGFELINSPYIIMRDLHIEPVITSRFVLDYPDCIYCTSTGCQFLYNELIGGRESISLFNPGATVIYGNFISGCGWHDGNKYRGTLYTHNNSGGTILIKHNILEATLGENCLSMWSATTNNVLDYQVLENAFLGNGILLASYDGISNNNLIRGNQMLGPIRLGASDQSGEQDKTIDGNRIYAGAHSLSLYYQTQGTIQNNIFVKDQFNDGLVDDYLPVGERSMVWLNNSYHNLDGNPFYRSDNPSTDWAEWQAATGETGNYSTDAPADDEIAFIDDYVPDQLLVCTWTGNVLTAERVS